MTCEGHPLFFMLIQHLRYNCFKIVSNCLLEEMDNQNKNTAAAGCASPLAEQKPGLTGESARKSGKMKNFTWKLLEMRSGKCIFVIWSGGVR